MKEYFGATAQKYQQTKGKQYLLFPTLQKYLGTAKLDNASMLDVGCGNGDFYQIAEEQHFHYFGLDISEEMISRAKQEYPKGEFQVSPATHFASLYTQKFDVVVVSMLFPSLRDKESIIATLKESKRVLTKDGEILIGLPYPCFDGYMQFGILGRKDVAANFQGYFQSEAEFKITHQLSEGAFTFEDCHWTLGDYIECIKNAGLVIDFIDECKPAETIKVIDKAFYEERMKFPTYLVLLVKQ